MLTLSSRKVDNVANLQPWVERPSGLLSWSDMERFSAEQFCLIAGWIERNAEKYKQQAQKAPTAKCSERVRIKLLANLKSLKSWCSLAGLHDSADAITAFIQKLPPDSEVTYGEIGWQLKERAEGIQREMKRHLFLYVPEERSQFYKSPLYKWELVIERFPSATNDIEEAAKCFALDRYAGAVFHMTRVVEHGVIEIGKLIDVKDPRPGWRSVRIALERILQKTEYSKLTALEKAHYRLLEQMFPAMLSIERAWRDKISHVANDLILLSGEFHPDVAEDIIDATRAFMRRLAMELPKRNTEGGN